ncbi:MAG TPA: hypothetical protein DDY78_09925 [Planctomycetales bacterium]|jgi:hypothetical protein|nr:hypothetical protein [Planctomycetales bacterium]
MGGMKREGGMRRIPGIWFAALVLALSCWMPLAFAQNSDFQDLHPNAKSGIVQPTAQPATADASDKPEKPAPTLSYAAAVLAAVVVLCIICVPTRKPESMTSR